MIHKYKLLGYNIVLDICSGSVHAVDEVAYDVIEMMEDALYNFENICSEESKKSIVDAHCEKYREREDITKEDILECYADVRGLISKGKLFTPDSFEPMADRLKEKTAGVIKALFLHIAHSCNLNCSYCFASQGNTTATERL